MGIFKLDLNSEKIKALKAEYGKIFKNGIVLLSVIIAASSVLIILDLHASGRVFPRTTVAGMPMGYTRVTAAQDKLLVSVEQYVKTPIIFNYNDQQVGLTPEELGIQVNVAQTINTVPIYDAENQSLLHFLASLFTSRDIPLQHSLNLDKGIWALQQKLNLADKRAKNAKLVFNGKEFIVEPESTGLAIKQDKLRADLEKSVNDFTAGPITIIVENETPKITAQELTAEKDRLIGLIQKPITLMGAGKKLSLKLAEHLDAVQFTQEKVLHIKNINNKTVVMPLDVPEETAIQQNIDSKLDNKLHIKLNAGALEKYLVDNFLKDIEIPTSPVNISKDQTGKIVIEGKGQDGQAVPRNRLMESIALAANNGIDRVQIPVVTEKAPLNISDDLKALGIKELIATGHTSFYTSHANRIHNISVGIAKYNGIIVKPGETFSFNKILGPVDGSTGFLPEKVIKKNKVEMEFGGGICQVSSTLYRAALFAGVPIIERNPHSWLVTYYGQVMGPGLDATIYPGVSDVKFINDTPSNILIQAYAENFHAYFKFYGTSDGRKVTMDGPFGAHLNWKWIRNLVDKDGKETKETIISNYRPMPVEPPPEATPPVPAPAAVPAKPTTPAAATKPATPAPKPAAVKPAAPAPHAAH